MTGAELQARRLALGWTLRQAAQAAGLAHTTIKRLESHTRTVGPGDYASGRKHRRSAYKLAVALNLVEPLADPRRIAMSADARVILHLSEVGGPASAGQIAFFVGETERSARLTLKRLEAAGAVFRTKPQLRHGGGSYPAEWSLLQ